MKKPIRFNDLSNPLQAVIIICCGICAVFLIFAIYNPRIDLQSQIDSLPHKYCHNETEVKEVNLTIGSKYLLDNNMYPSDNIVNYLCSEQRIYPLNYSIYSLIYYKCLIEEQKEVCEIR